MSRPAMDLAQLLPQLRWQPPLPAAGLPISQLAYDSRQVRPGALFAAWRGRCSDGHAYAAQAVARGATALVCERPVGLPEGLRAHMAVVPHVRQTLALAAQRYFGDPAAQLRMLAVTGTNGKTTCVHVLRSICTAAGLPCGTVGTLGAWFAGAGSPGRLTTPESVDLLELLAQMRQAGAQAVAMEASSQALVQRRLDGVRFDAALFLNLTQDHLDYHGTMEQYLAAKTLLFTQLRKADGVAVLNLGDAAVAALRPRLRGPTLGFCVDPAPTTAAEVSLRQHTLSERGMQLQVQTPRGLWDLTAPLQGRFNVENVLGCVAVAVALGLDEATVATGLRAATAAPGRLQKVSGPCEPQVWVDYAHTPAALRRALAAARELCAGRLVCVMGCGGERDPQKRAAMGEAAMAGSDAVVLTNDNPRGEDPQVIARAVEVGLRQAGGHSGDLHSPRSYCVQLDRAAAITLALAACTAHDGLLIAGKGHEDYQLIGTQRLHFDDAEVAQQALAARRLAAPERACS